MSELTNYIKERIKELRPKLKEAWVSTEYFCISEQISELQAVLSKIEELDKEIWAKWLEEYEKRFPTSRITSSIVDHKPITKEDIISKS